MGKSKNSMEQVFLCLSVELPVAKSMSNDLWKFLEIKLIILDICDGDSIPLTYIV